jgi:hypothetical protein
MLTSNATINMIKKTVKSVLAIAALPRAIPVNPNNAAIKASTKKRKEKYNNIVFNLHYVTFITECMIVKIKINNQENESYQSYNHCIWPVKYYVLNHLNRNAFRTTD